MEPIETDETLEKELISSLPNGGVTETTQAQNTQESTDDKEATGADGPADEQRSAGGGADSSERGSANADSLGNIEKDGADVSGDAAANVVAEGGHEHSPAKHDNAGNVNAAQQPSAQNQPADGQAVRGLTQAEKELAAVEEKIAAEDFDPYSKEGKAALIQHGRLAAKVEAEPIKSKIAEDSVYEQYSAEHGLAVDDLKAGWKEVLKSLPAKYKNDSGAANLAYDQWIEKQKAAPKPPAPKKAAVTAPTPITPKGGAIVPPSMGNGVPPQPKEKTEDDELVDFYSRVKGGVKAAIGR